MSDDGEQHRHPREWSDGTHDSDTVEPPPTQPQVATALCVKQESIGFDHPEEVNKQLDRFWDVIQLAMTRHDVEKIAAAVGLDDKDGPLPRGQHGVLVSANDERKGETFCTWLTDIIAMPCVQDGHPLPSSARTTLDQPSTMPLPPSPTPSSDPAAPTNLLVQDIRLFPTPLLSASNNPLNIPLPPSPKTSNDPSSSTALSAQSKQSKRHESFLSLKFDTNTQRFQPDESERDVEQVAGVHLTSVTDKLHSEIVVDVEPATERKDLAGVVDLKATARFNFLRGEFCQIHRASIRPKWKGGHQDMNVCTSNLQDSATFGTSRTTSAGLTTLAATAAANPSFGVQHQTGARTQQDNSSASFVGNFVAEELLHRAFEFFPRPGVKAAQVKRYDPTLNFDLVQDDLTLQIPDLIETPSSRAKNVMVVQNLEIGGTALRGCAHLKGSKAPETAVGFNRAPNAEAGTQVCQHMRDRVEQGNSDVGQSRMKQKIADIKHATVNKVLTASKNNKDSKNDRFDEVELEQVPSDLLNAPVMSVETRRLLKRDSDADAVVLRESKGSARAINTTFSTTSNPTKFADNFRMG
ncbi:hypothetical protein ACM66B_000350 [Microbotryomycetes sp. NB124-2]